MLRYWLFQAHWLVGITAGVVLATVGTTGAILAFETEIVDWLNRDVRTVEARHAPLLPAPELLARIQAAEPTRRILSLTVQASPALTARVTFADDDATTDAGSREHAPGSETRRRAGQGVSRYVDPYDGHVLPA